MWQTLSDACVFISTVAFPFQEEFWPVVAEKTAVFNTHNISKKSKRNL